MRMIIYALSVSLDGYIEYADGRLDWSVPSEELHQHFNDQYLTGETDTSIYGRRLYENMAAYWPTAADNPDTESVELEFARLWMTLPNIVFSTSLESVDSNSTLKREPIRAEIAERNATREGQIDVG